MCEFDFNIILGVWNLQFIVVLYFGNLFECVFFIQLI